MVKANLVRFGVTLKHTTLRMVFPLIKLSMLAVRQISKPLSTFIKRQAAKNELFRRYFILPPAQLYHKVGVRSKMWMLGLKQPSFISPLNHSMAIDTGSELFCEVLIFTSCVCLLILEFSRQSRKDKKKHDIHRREKQELKKEINELSDRINNQVNEMIKLKQNLIKARIWPNSEFRQNSKVKSDYYN